MAKHRLRFSKTGRAVYLSHLDLLRTFQRVFARAGVSVRYTEGFNPQAYVSIPLPLSVGVGSMCELLDFELVDNTSLDTLPKRLTEKMPEGIAVTEAYTAWTKCKDIAWLRVKGSLQYDGDMAERSEKLAAFYARESILVKKRTKKKAETIIDIKPLIREITFQPAGAHEVRLETVIAAQNPGLNPNLLIGALEQQDPDLLPDFTQFTRIEVYDTKGHPFR